MNQLRRWASLQPQLIAGGPTREPGYSSESRNKLPSAKKWPRRNWRGLRFSSTDRLPSSTAGGFDLVAGKAESVIGVRADCRDRRDADHNDQGEHHSILDRGGTIFFLQKPNDLVAY